MLEREGQVPQEPVFQKYVLLMCYQLTKRFLCGFVKSVKSSGLSMELLDDVIEGQKFSCSSFSRADSALDYPENFPIVLININSALPSDLCGICNPVISQQHIKMLSAGPRSWG